MSRSDFTGIADVVGGGLPESKVTASSTALVIIDMQYADAHPDWGLGARARELGITSSTNYFYSRLETTVIPNIKRILDACRRATIQVVHVRVMNLVEGSLDTSWRYKMMRFLVSPDSQEAKILEELTPASDEIVLNKTTSNVFVSTNADFLFRNMGIDTLIVTGVATNNCVESSTRGAGDLGYRVLLVDDACAAWTQEAHDHAMRHLDHNFAIVKTTDAILYEIVSLNTLQRLKSLAQDGS